MLHRRTLYDDGTWSLCRNLKHKQIYIFSINQEQNGKIFSYPIFQFLMKKREKKLLELMQKVYFDKFQQNLEIASLHVDCEKAVINAFEEKFPNGSIILCSVHIIFRQKVDATFYKDPVLLNLWRIITGALYRNLSNDDIPEKIRTSLSDVTVNVYKDKQVGFTNFLKYLNETYFDENARFNPGYYAYYDAILLNGDYATSNNSLKRINRCLKEVAAGGYLPLSRVCRVLQRWIFTFPNTKK